MEQLIKTNSFLSNSANLNLVSLVKSEGKIDLEGI